MTGNHLKNIKHQGDFIRSPMTGYATTMTGRSPMTGNATTVTERWPMTRGPKIAFWLKKELFWAIGARKRPAEQLNGHLLENRGYPGLPQDMGKI